MGTINKKKILILSNHHAYTYNFRKEVIQDLLDNGYKVYITLPYGEKVELLKEMGCSYIESPLDRRGMNPVNDSKLINSYYKIIKKINPDVVLSYTIKPNLYGGLVCRFLKIPFIPNVTGLGTALDNKGLLHKILINLYKISFKNASSVLFQNEDNKNFFIKENISLKRTRVIPGSGINVKEFPYKEYPKDNENIRFLFIGRIMRDKGIEELIDAANQVKEEYNNLNLQFDAIGFYEDEYKKKADSLKEQDIITFHGAKDNVKEYLEDSHAIIHPTYHEGMSNVLLEAAATGRPIIASNIPGCREIFDEGITGFGFEVKNSNSLVKAIKRFINLPYHEKELMGIHGRNKIEKEFDRQKIVEIYSEEIKRILGGK